MKTHSCLSDKFPEYMTQGAIFSKMLKAPWIKLGIGLEMDIFYLAHNSGMKIPTYFIDALSTDGVLDQQKVAEVLWSMYGHNWERLWDAYMTEYVPIENYNVKEDIDRTLKNDKRMDRTTDEKTSSDDSLQSTRTTTDKQSINESKTGKKTTNESGGETTSISEEDSTSDNETTTTKYGKVVNSTSTETKTEDDITSLTHGEIIDTTTNSSEDRGETSSTTYGKKIDTTNDTVTKEDESTTTTYGKTVSLSSETDIYAYAFNSPDKVPTSVNTETSSEEQGGKDLTERDLSSTANETGNETQSGTDKTTTSVDGTTTKTAKETHSGTDKTVVDITGQTSKSGTDTYSGSDVVTRGLIGSKDITKNEEVKRNSNSVTDDEISGESTKEADTNETVNDTSTSSTTSTVVDGSSETVGEDENITRTRAGNIGQNTYQELLRQEIELWKWNFYAQVFSDCDRVLTIQVYC